MSKTVVSSDNAPAAIGPYSPGIQTGNMVFLSGQLGIDPATGKLPEGVEAQAKQSLANVEALLTAAGATFADVVKTTVYLADIADFAAVNEIYASKFEAPFPARSAFQVAALPAGGLVDPATGKLPEGVEAQAKQSLANVEALLTAAGATFADVVKTTVYLADIADFAAVNEIYASKFEAPFPARSAFQVAALPAGGLVEIEVVAAL